MRDLLGQPITYPETSPSETAARLYELGDNHQSGSPERQELYQRAAAAQRRAEAAHDLAKSCHERLSKGTRPTTQHTKKSRPDEAALKLL